MKKLTFLVFIFVTSICSAVFLESNIIIQCSKCGGICSWRTWREPHKPPNIPIIKTDDFPQKIQPIMSCTAEIRYHTQWYEIQCTSCNYKKVFEQLEMGE